MREQVRSRIADGLERTGLLRPVDCVRASWLVLRAGEPVALEAEGAPLPPPRLRLLVDGRSPDVGAHLRLGRQMWQSIHDACAESGNPTEEMRAVLDFGCGCGRVLRHWPAAGPEVHGCDYNPGLVGWCAENLAPARVTRNGLTPPTPYVSESFDLIYALSVFSHLGPPLQRQWLAEFRRLLRPGGLLVLSVIGDSLRHRLGPAERAHFDRGEMVVQRPRLAGRNLCTVYHPRAHVTGGLLADFAEVRRFDLGSAAQAVLQDAYIARRPLSAAA